MAIATDLYRVQLKNAHVSNTSSRAAIFDTLISLDHAPISMSSLVASLEGRVDRATVYRTVELFESIGIIKKIYTGWKYQLELGDEFQMHHHHITCTGCAKVISLQNDRLEKALELLGLENDFLITDHVIEIRGLCDRCR